MKQALLKLDLKILREMLRLPQDVKITGVRSDPDSTGRVILDIESNWLPGEGELIAKYKDQHTTVVNFEGWETRD